MEFSKCQGRPGTFLMDDHMPLDDCFVRYSHSCFLGLDDPRGQIGVGSIFNSPS